jgi:hypothetical protein
MNVSITHPTDRPNYARVDVGAVTVWFSYRTAIAFHTADTGTVARQNDWGPTTGKHLNDVGVDKADRLPGDVFSKALAEALATANA